VTLIKEGEDVYPMDALPENQRDVWATAAAETMKGSVGLSMSVSVLTAPFRDEECLRVMKEIERVAEFSTIPSAYLEKAKSRQVV
jgi:hypothetical protein